MIGALIQLIIVLLIAGVFWYLISALLPLVPLPAPFAQIINVLLVCILALIVIYYALIPLLHGLGSGGKMLF